MKYIRYIRGGALIKEKNAPENNSQIENIMYTDTLHLDTYKITLAFYSIE